MDSEEITGKVSKLMVEEKILIEYRTIAVVGASPNPERPSNEVAYYLMEQGYHVIPVNPAVDEVLGLKSYPDLSSISQQVEVVDVFRRSEQVMPIVEEAIKIGAKAVWMQEGVINHEAAAKAENAGLLVVMNKCMLKEYAKINP